MLRHVNRAGSKSRLLVVLAALAAFALFAPSSAPPPAPDAATAGPVPSGFVETTALSGLTNPMVVRFASDGRIFVAEKSGLIKVFDSLSDTTPTTFADLRTNVYNFWDRGLLGMALHPEFPVVPYVYVLYTFDHVLGDPAPPPRWGTPGATSDPCPSPPGALSDGCVVSGRLSRLQAAGNVMTGSEQVLVEDWCQQYPSHSLGAVEVGPDGMVYASAGEGANWTLVDYGQEGDPVNPCGDPGGSSPTPPTAEGGALRSQDLRTSGDPAGLDGSIIRVDPSTGAAAPGNPLSGSPDPNARRIIAHGFRNPFRFAFRPGTNELWIGDAGWNDWEEIDRIVDPTSSVLNFGWPCYEGPSKQGGYDAADLALCETLYAQPSADTKPYFAYHHSSKVVAGESCATGTSSVSGLSFEFAPTGGTFPVEYAGALFFADYSRRCIWAMTRNGNQPPSPGSIRTFVEDAAGPVNLEFGPDGSLYYTDFDGGTIRRVSYGVAPPEGPTYEAAVHYGTGTNAHGVAVAHLNGDGRLDLAVANAGSNTVSVLLGQGDGTFGPATSFAVGVQPKSVAASDFNGDGRVDLVTADQNSNTVSVLLGNGAGSFAAAASYAVCSGAHEVAVGGFNGDGRPDLAVACHGGSGGRVISVLLATGSGTFGPAVDYTVGISPNSLVVGDYNRDGNADLAVTNHDGDDISVLPGRGDGTFATRTDYAVGGGPHSIRKADLNGDGLVDLVTANDRANTVSVLLGTAAGTFSPASHYATGLVPKGIAVGDFNGDGKHDVVTANTAGRYPSGDPNPGGDQVSILLGSGTGTLGAPTSYQTGNTPFAVAVARLDGDARPDLVTANWFGHSASVLLSGGGAPPPPPPGIQYLSDLAWTQATNGWGPVERDMSNGEAAAADGSTLTLNGATYAKGLGAHSLSDVRFAISDCSRFKADIGVDDEVAANGSVTFEVWAGASKAYDSGLMTGTSSTQQIDVSIAGATELRLVVGNGGDNADADHADWAMARVECSSGSDTTPPAVTGRTPPDGATGTAVDARPTATFSEAIDPATLTTSTFWLAPQGQATPLAASVSYDGASRTATLTPSASLQPSTSYTATVEGGSGGVKDVAGNTLASDVSWSFTTGSGDSTTSYLSDLTWSSMTNGWGPVERDLSNGDSGAADGRTLTLDGATYAKGLGAHALSDVRFAISGCSRFKADVGVDDEVGDFGSVVFQVFAGPTKIYDSGVMRGITATKSVDVGISGASELRLVVTDGGDGIAYDHADWGLARIECVPAGPDTTPPTVTGRTPPDGATGIAVDARPTATFSEAIDPATLTTSTFWLAPQGQATPLAASVSYDGASRTATLTPSASLQPSTSYTATVEGGSGGVKDVAGNTLASDVSWSFTTAAAANIPPAPRIDTPPSTLTWAVGDLISFAGGATDAEQGTLPPSALSWTLLMQHCPSNCHSHSIQSWAGVASGSFNAPDHEYPSHLELRLTATDAQGASATISVRLDPKTVVLTFASAPGGLQLSVNGSTEAGSFTRTVIVGSTNSVSAISPQVLNGTTYEFSSWSDGGAQTHNVLAPSSATTFTATYVIAPPRNVTLPSVSGQTRVGRTLTASDGTWTGSQPMTFSYQWLRCTTTALSSCTAISGATAKTYVATSADVDRRLRARVTAVNAGGSASATSAATGRVRT